MKKLVTAVMIVAFALSSASLVMAAKSAKCTVDNVDGDKVTMTCKDAKLKAGDKVKVKSAAKGAVEGC
jgi:hypothetical protein